MRRYLFSLPALALSAATPSAAQQVDDFKLPPGATPAPENRAQGPVDPDAPVVSRPRVIETAPPAPIVLPSPRAAAPTNETPARTSPSAVSTRQQAASSPAAPQRAGNPLPAPAPLKTAALPSLQDVPQASSAPLPAPVANPVAVPVDGDGDGGGLPWTWFAMLGLVLAASGAGYWLFVRRRGAAVPGLIEPPVSAPVAGAPRTGLQLSVEALRLDRSLFNATLGYRVTVRNPDQSALSGLVIEADLVSASQHLPTEKQLASPDSPLAQQHSAERLGPGQSQRFEGHVRLPLAEATAIRQGKVGLLVPLLRVRAHAGGVPPVVTTLVVGTSQGPASRPQPFRLDEGPRSYVPLAQRVLDAVPAHA